MKILYLPIYEPGAYHERSVANKSGLRNALSEWGDVIEFDYLKPDQEIMQGQFYKLLSEWNPDILFTQLQGTDRITEYDLRVVRSVYKDTVIVNWNGDYWERSLTSPDMLALLKHVDLQLVVNGSTLATYAKHGINAKLWPHSFERANRPLPDVPSYDVVYLGNNYSEKRAELYKVLRTLPCSVGIYGNGWPESEGECTYDFTYGEALYRNAKIAISDNEYTYAIGYLSNRPFQAMSAGCFVLQQTVRDLEEQVGLISHIHYGNFGDINDLPMLVTYWLKDERGRQAIAESGQNYVLRAHSFEARVKQLFEQFIPEELP